VDRGDPYLFADPLINKRPALLDPLDWVDGWPTVRAGRWASDRPMPAPAAQPGQRTRYVPRRVAPEVPGRLLPAYSDSFAGDALDPRWTWVRPPDPATYRVGGGAFGFDTQDADLTTGSNTASVLTEPSPGRDFVLQTTVHLDLPAEGCCQNYVQAGLVVYGSDDSFVKLSHVSIWETRQTEFAKEETTSTGPRYGNTVIGPPAETTYLRIVRRTSGGHTLFTGYTGTDGRKWVRGGTWQADALRTGARIGLVSMGGAGDFHARFDDVRVWTLR
jgi:arabinan endo-1,5-alpha-L-arabinosidase